MYPPEFALVIQSPDDWQHPSHGKDIHMRWTDDDGNIYRRRFVRYYEKSSEPDSIASTLADNYILIAHQRGEKVYQHRSV